MIVYLKPMSRIKKENSWHTKKYRARYRALESKTFMMLHNGTCIDMRMCEMFGNKITVSPVTWLSSYQYATMYKRKMWYIRKDWTLTEEDDFEIINVKETKWFV